MRRWLCPRPGLPKVPGVCTANLPFPGGEQKGSVWAEAACPTAGLCHWRWGPVVPCLDAPVAELRCTDRWWDGVGWGGDSGSQPGSISCPSDPAAGAVPGRRVSGLEQNARNCQGALRRC